MLQTFKRPARVSLAVAAACAAVAACAHAAPEPAGQAVEAIPLLDLVRNIKQLRGETVRVCDGAWSSTRRTENGRVLGWMYSNYTETPRRSQVSLQVAAACGTKRPRLERGCLTGRIAREDGSLTLSDTAVVGSHGIANYEWWLHPQCAPSSR